MKINEIFEIDGVFYKQVYDGPKHSCNSCALNEKCGSNFIGVACENKHFEKADIEPTKEMIRRVLRLSHEAEKVFNEGCHFIIGNTIDEQIDNIKRQQAGLSSDERIKFIKDFWHDYSIK